MTRKVEGVITPLGSGAVSDGKTWDLALRLNPWRGPGGPLVLTDLRVLIPMDHDAASAAMSKWRGGVTITLAVSDLREPDGEHEIWQARGELPILPIRPDDALAEVIARRAVPKAVEHPVLGRLALDRRFNVYGAGKRDCGGRCGVMVETPDPDDDDAVARALDAAAAVVGRVERDEHQLREAIADELLDLYNRRWRGERPVARRELFVDRVVLDGVVVSPYGTTAYFQDGGFFLGHVIEVRMSSEGEVEEICLSG